ncbi:hypothetical protein FCV61_13620 [Vibrio sp. F12]|nr:hypothetical protein FCV56_00965 [Vibrio sp. F12]TKE97340.1 hypothetical protein FCV61_13620 [Vibrio sp. F12]
MASSENFSPSAISGNVVRDLLHCFSVKF